MRKAEPEMTAAIRIVHLSDTHLSATHAYFEDNWHAVREAVIAERPDLVLHGGDLCFNAPANPDDLAFAAAQLRSLGVPWLAVAGNHDVGEAPRFSRLAQPLTDARIAAWRAHVGPSWWWRDIGAWRIVGIDTALLASGRPEEVEQIAFLREALGTRGIRPVLLVLHMPAFHDARSPLSGARCPARPLRRGGREGDAVGASSCSPAISPSRHGDALGSDDRDGRLAGAPRTQGLSEARLSRPRHCRHEPDPSAGRA
jgi:3',5'-cyclic AMP phosphodiesterase CpdA